MSQHTVPIAVDDLRVGVTCSHPVEGDQGVLLLGANTRITQQVIAGLRDRGITSIEVDPRDLAALRGGGAAKARKRTSARDLETDGIWPKSKPVRGLLVDRYDEDLSESRAQLLQASMKIAKSHVAQLKVDVVQQNLSSVADMAQVSDGYAWSIVEDHDHTVLDLGSATAMLESDQRSVRLSTLAMAVAVEMGLDAAQMLDIGMAGLLSDVGLYQMDPKFSDRDREFSASEWWEYQKHPNLARDTIRDVIDVNESVQLAVQQIHEQFDGSGYPRGLKGPRIHQNARILNVVDSYLRLISGAGDRAPIVPHDAVGLMLHLASRGMYDPQVVKAFLKVETLFPLGSNVELSSGQVAQVIRRPQSGFAAPVLKSAEGSRIELETHQVEIVRPVCDETMGQIRLSNEDMSSTQWHPAGPDTVI